MGRLKKPYTGVWNILRFNWPMFAFAIVLLGILCILTSFETPYKTYLFGIEILLIIVVVTSVVVSFYIYDYSSLYDLDWLNAYIPISGEIANIHAGFDETSGILLDKYPQISLTTLDFYDPLTHTESSIRRARKIYQQSPGTINIKTTNIPFPDNSMDTILTIFSAHEIRNPHEREGFFKELRRIVKPDGSIILTEHVRDWRNFLAYNIGFLHFYSNSSWIAILKRSNLNIEQEFWLTPFIKTFICRKNGNTR